MQIRQTKVIPLATVEKRAIFDAIIKYNGNRSVAAKALGICPKTLRSKLRTWSRYGVLPASVVAALKKQERYMAK